MWTNSALRLIWKEYREGWPVIAAFIILPGLVLPISRYFPEDHVMAWFPLAVVFAVPFTCVLWGSEKRRMSRQNRDILEAVLPVSPIQGWLFTFLLPALIVGLCGAWMHALFARSGFVEGSYQTDSLGMIAVKGMLTIMLAYMISSYVSKAVSHIAGIILGTIWVVYTIFPPSAIPVWGYILGIIILAVASITESEYPKSSPRVNKFRTYAAIILFVAAVNWNPLVSLVKEINELEGDPLVGDGVYIENENLGISVALRYLDGKPVIFYSDYVRRKVTHGDMGMVPITYPLSSSTLPLAIDDVGHVYVISETTDKHWLEIKLWNPTAGSIKSLGKLSADKAFNLGTLSTSYYEGEQRRYVDPSGSWIIIRTPSAVSKQRGIYDWWLIDIKKNERRLLIAGESNPADSIRWVGSDAYLYNTGNGYATQEVEVLRIDITSGTVKRIRPGKWAQR